MLYPSVQVRTPSGSTIGSTVREVLAEGGARICSSMKQDVNEDT